MPTIAVIDVGSNTIKLLVARRGPRGEVESVLARTCEARISRGISAERPLLGEEGMRTGLEALRSLLADCAPYAPERIEIVATSAVRSAGNGEEFRSRVREETGRELRILSGDEEAELIGLGLRTDPSLGSLSDFYVFDLGGGSMECLIFANKLRRAALSLPLGCVRLTERFVKDASAPVSAAALQAVAAHTRELIDATGLQFDLKGATAVFAGGSMTTARAILGALKGKTLQQTGPRVGLDQLEALLARIAALPLSERAAHTPGLHAARADVFPAALATMIETGRCAGVDAFQHSFNNLRSGLAARMLGAEQA